MLPRAPPRRVVRVGVLGSTRGSSLQPILEALGAAVLGGIEIALVISNKKDAGILTRAAQHGLPWRHVPCKKGTPRAEYDAVVTSHLEAAGCEMLLLIGFMRIVSPEFCARWDRRALNVHPSLLPAHAGGMDLEVHQAVVDAKEASSGCTVHFVEAEVDGGAICVQKSCPVLPDDTAETLKARVQPLEGPALIEATLKVAQFCRDADAPPADADAPPADARAARGAPRRRRPRRTAAPRRRRRRWRRWRRLRRGRAERRRRLSRRCAQRGGGGAAASGPPAGQVDGRALPGGRAVRRSRRRFAVGATAA